jgi:YYY domain-containing protein
MLDVLRWWLVATLIGLIAVPYAYRLFPFLPDRGVTAARALGLLLVVFPLWWLAVLGLAPYTAGTALFLLAALGAGAVALGARDRAGLLAHLRAYRHLLVAGEIVFAIFLLGLAAFRAYAPAIEGTEKLFEFAFLNGVLRSERMPAADPWFAGEPMSYYYGGYLVVALVTKLAGTTPAVAFNLGVALTGALTAVGAFGLGANLALALRGRRRARAGTAAIAAGAMSVVLLLIIGNLEGVFELAAAHGWGSPAFYERLGIEGLTGPMPSQHWYPDGFWFWWRATRLGSIWNVLEFPFFSFMLGDLHAHVLVLPFSLLGLAALLNLLRAGEPPSWAGVRRRPWPVLVLSALTAMLALTNSWDQPVFLALLFGTALVQAMAPFPVPAREQEAAGRDDVRPPARVEWGVRVVRALAFTAVPAVLSLVLDLPLLLHLHAATQGIAPVELANPPAVVNGEGMVLPPHHFLMFWGPLLVVAAGAVLVQAGRARAWRLSAADRWLVLGITLAPLVAWAAAVGGVHRDPGAVLTELRARATWWAGGSYWLVQGGVLTLVFLGLLALLAEARRPVGTRRPGRLYLLLALTAGLALTHLVELFYVKEPQATRTNTLFKFSYTAWLLLATAGGAALVDAVYAWWRARPRSRSAATGMPIWFGATGALLLLALVYPVTAAFNRTDGFRAPMTLDGLAALRAADPHEYDAVQWLRRNLTGRPLLLEAVGNDYSLGGRFSARTGLPTVVGWPFHEAQERGGRDYTAMARRIAARVADVETIYRTADEETARALLARYGVDYVIAGRLEAAQYGTEGLAKFDRVGHAVYRNPAVTIWWVGAQAPVLGGRR